MTGETALESPAESEMQKGKEGEEQSEPEDPLLASLLQLLGGRQADGRYRREGSSCCPGAYRSSGGGAAW